MEASYAFVAFVSISLQPILIRSTTARGRRPPCDGRTLRRQRLLSLVLQDGEGPLVLHGPFGAGLAESCTFTPGALLGYVTFLTTAGLALCVRV